MLAMFRGLDMAERAVLPVEIMLLPMWSPFHLNNIRTGRDHDRPLMGLSLVALNHSAKNVSGIANDELFPAGPHSIG